MKTFLISLCLLFSSVSFGACLETLERYNEIQLQVSEGGRACYLSLHPMEVDNLVYRDYLFSSDGLMMVFNSYGEGDDATHTGAREYFFLPRKKELSYKYDQATGKLTVQMPSGQDIVFDSLTGNLVSITDAQVKIDPKVVKTNKGGVEVTSNKGVFLDVGFALGKSPASVKTGTSRFKGQKECSVKNSEIFTYPGNGDVFFKLSDKDLSVFLKQRCSIEL